MNKESLLEQYIQEGVDYLNSEQYAESFDAFSRAMSLAPLREDIKMLLHKSLEGKIAQEGIKGEMELQIVENNFKGLFSLKKFKFVFVIVIILAIIWGVLYSGYYIYHRYYASVTVSDASVSNAEDTKKADDLYSQALNMINIKNYDKAIELLEEASSINPTNMKYQRKIASVAAQKGYQLYNKNDFLGAIELFKRAVEYDPNNPEYYRNLGWSYLEIGTRKKNRGEYYEDFFKKAEEAHKQAINIDPDFAGAYYGLGYVYVRQNKINEAITNFKKAITTQSDSEWAEKSKKALKSLGVY